MRGSAPGSPEGEFAGIVALCQMIPEADEQPGPDWLIGPQAGRLARRDCGVDRIHPAVRAADVRFCPAGAEAHRTHGAGGAARPQAGRCRGGRAGGVEHGQAADARRPPRGHRRRRGDHTSDGRERHGPGARPGPGALVWRVRVPQPLLAAPAAPNLAVGAAPPAPWRWPCFWSCFSCCRWRPRDKATGRWRWPPSSIGPGRWYSGAARSCSPLQRSPWSRADGWRIRRSWHEIWSATLALSGPLSFSLPPISWRSRRPGRQPAWV